MKWIPLPIGVDSFEKIIRNHYYYIDKTLYIKELLDRKGEVESFYPSPSVWKDSEHEYAPVLF